ncbi:MAG: NUDIX domain-containing protein [Candidatus Micrarchaeia archaeon]
MQALKQNVGKAKNGNLLKVKRTSVSTTSKSFFCFIFSKDHVLLEFDEKKGFWMPISGEIGEGENVEEAAARNVYKKTGLVINSFEPIGKLFLIFEGEAENNKEVYIFISTDFSGTEKRENTLAWARKEELASRLPYYARLFLPALLSARRFKGEFFFDYSYSTKPLRYKIEQL